MSTYAPHDGTYTLNRANGRLVRVRYVSGYAVGHGAYGWQLPAGTPVSDIPRLAAASAPFMADRGEYVGIWTDPDTGVTYVDPVDIVHDIDDALTLGAARGELCVWDFTREQTVDCADRVNVQHVASGPQTDIR